MEIISVTYLNQAIYNFLIFGDFSLIFIYNSCSMKKFSALLFIFLAYFSGFAQLSPTQIDSLVEKTMKTFNVPGMAVAVLKDGEIYMQNTYGIQSIQTKKPVDKQTMFGVASNTKAFTTAALAQLVDQGKITWDTKVNEIIPEFKLYNPYVTEEFTIRDLLVHRSGLGLGAGDLMVIPASNTTTLDEMIHNLRYLKPVSSFRTKYDYDNLLYVVAGEIVARVSEESFDEYIENHFFKPLKMTRSELNIAKIEKDKNRIDGHAPVDGKLQITPPTFTQISTPAAGIYASIEDMTKWVQARIDYGKYGENLQDSLFSKKQAIEMWKPHTILNAYKGDYNTNFSAYALGWGVTDVKGYFQASHTGGLFGIVSQVTIIPDLKLGIIVLTNQESGAAFMAITNSIKDGYLDIKGKDRIDEYYQRRIAAEKRADKIMKEVNEELQRAMKSAKNKLNEESIIGLYKDNWFGEVSIEKNKKGKLRFEAKKSPELIGELQFYKGTTYVVKWDNQSFNADAFVNFDLNTEGKATGFSMKAISPLTDFSFDFHDLDFERLKGD